MSSTGNTYHPKDHGGLKKDGTPDSRVKQDNIDESQADNAQSYSDSSDASGDNYKPTEHGGLKKDGTRDHRVKDDNVTAEADE
ncbi:hypothetical protein DFJ77DRAFT_478950 [Powellomyces hirtus]|nr:hypothetical protein DFJ77DRAFT_478950 [Powellomyces hirtus]